MKTLGKILLSYILYNLRHLGLYCELFGNWTEKGREIGELAGKEGWESLIWKISSTFLNVYN
jgi:hypothetical protein